MTIVAAIILLLVCVGLLLQGDRKTGAIFAGLGVVTFVASAAYWPSGDVDTGAQYRPQDRTEDKGTGYVSSRTCRSCHPGEYETWSRTYHRTMTQVASERSVLSDFNRSFERDGRSYRVWREGDKFMADVPAFGTEGERSDDRLQAEVVMTTGSHHMQAYWMPVPMRLRNVERRGQEHFRMHCASCHGPNGEGGKGGELVGLGLIPDELESWIADGDLGHPETVEAKPGCAVIPERRLDEVERKELGDYVARIQFDGRLTQFPFVYLIDSGRWAHEEDTFLQPPVAVDAQERPGDRWGMACDECHSVSPRFSVNYEDLTAKSETVELGIACEACHGEGGAHVERYQNPMARYLEGPNAIVNPAKLDYKRSSYVCAQCHAEVEDKGPVRLYQPGDDFEQSVHVVRVPKEGETPDWLKGVLRSEPDRLTGAFWDDGTVRVAGRDFNGVAESACYTKGQMGCLSCHAMHGGSNDAYLKPGMDGDAACTQCHAAEATNIEAHTRHPAGSSGSRCQNCHMPYTTFGLLQAIRSHRVDSPSIDRTAKTGRPDACTNCHLDKSLGWADAKLVEWFGAEPATLTDAQRERPAGLLWALEGDAVQRGIAAWHMGWEPAREASSAEWMTPGLLELLDDRYAAVRSLAEGALRRQPGFEDIDYDFTVPEDERKLMAKRARLHWAELGRPGADEASALLHAENHGALEQALLGMLARRNTEDVRINE